jgi:purine-nucleoside/S-methyl-5'-thioadenosine phosphorylase / adenosine deaminase
MAMFTSRHGGVSAPPYDALNLSRSVGDLPDAVQRNRDLLQRACGPGSQPVSWLRQVHGSAVRQVGAVAAAQTDAGADPQAGADAQFTATAGLPLGVLVADCAPVLIADGEARIIGVAHAGRAGLVAGVVPALLAAMARAGAAPSRMSAALGPLICGSCYEVPEQLRDTVQRAVPGAGCVTRWGSPGIDIRAGIEAQLALAGVPQVTSDPRCTAESPELYSYRRDGTTGRFAGVIWLTS